MKGRVLCDFLYGFVRFAPGTDCFFGWFLFLIQFFTVNQRLKLPQESNTPRPRPYHMTYSKTLDVIKEMMGGLRF